MFRGEVQGEKASIEMSAVARWTPHIGFGRAGTQIASPKALEASPVGGGSSAVKCGVGVDAARTGRCPASRERGRTRCRARRMLAAAIVFTSIVLLAPNIASALPPGSEYPAFWGILEPAGTAFGSTSSGADAGVTATLNQPSSGTLTWAPAPGGPPDIPVGEGSLILNGANPAFFPATTDQALQVMITGCSQAPCGSITYNFYQPGTNETVPQAVITPSLLVGDVGTQEVSIGPEVSNGRGRSDASGDPVSTYHDSPISIAGGGTFTLDSTGSQSPNMSIQSGGTVIGITSPAAYVGQEPFSPPASCGPPPPNDGYGCGAYDLQLPVAATTSVTLNFGYAGTGTNPDIFTIVLADVPSNPALTIAKTATPTTVHKAGDTVSYSYLVTNTGNVTLTNVGVTDTFSPPSTGLSGPISCPETTLAPGASTTCTAPEYIVTQADFYAGAINNSAIATGTPPSGPAINSPASTATVNIPPAPSLELVKSATPTTVHKAGDKVSYSYLVTNTGNVTLTNVGVTDTFSPPSTGLSGPISCPETTLTPGVSTTCTAPDYVVTQADVDAGAINNSAVATGTPSLDPAVNSPASTATVDIPPAPSLELLKTATPTTVHKAGDTVSYSYLVTNTGNVTLTNVGVIDTFARPSSGLSGPISCPETTLAPGASMTCTAPEYVVTQADVDAGAINNSATAIGDPPSGPPIDSTPSTATVEIPTARIELGKSADVASFDKAGTVVRYSYAVKNTGNVTLDPVVVSDSMRGLSAISCPHSSLVPGESMTCTAKYTTTKADLRAGEIKNTGTATGTPPRTPADPNPKPISETSTMIVPARVLTLKKTASQRVVKAGQRLTYHLTVSDPTPRTIDNVRVCDQVPLGLAYASSSPKAKLRNGSRCWIFERIAAHESKTIKLTATALHGASGKVFNHATARAPGVPTVEATRAVRVIPSPKAPTPVTG